jgi:uncharacterized protein DUF937
MSTNLVSLIMQFLTPDVIARIATALGLDRNSAQSAIGAAVPALLAGFTGAAERPSGAQNLADAISRQSGALNNFTSMVSGSGASSLVDQGSALLKSVLGGQDQAAIAGAVSKFAGIGQGAGNSLLAMLAPLAMGMIGKQLGGGNMNPGSLASLLSSQKGAIAQALPGGFDRLLSGTGILDSLSGVPGAAAAAVADQARRAAGAASGQVSQFGTSTAYSVGSAGQRAASVVPTWTYWVLPLLVALGLIWYLVSYRAGDQLAQVTPPALPPAQSVLAGGVDIGKQLGDSLNALRTSLQGITDVASARAALPNVQTATAQVDKVNGLLGQLTDDQRKTITAMTAPATTALNSLFDKVLAIPGVNDVLKPAADTLKTRLADLSAHSTTIGSGRPQ